MDEQLSDALKPDQAKPDTTTIKEKWFCAILIIIKQSKTLIDELIRVSFC